ncbi:DUF4238 domain-containing protein [Sinomonas humi]|uniref:DUF4238 domain-containing protein n=1 Tax=Sinomonas humi TaxID=1338436 RepID=UPI00068BCFE3|nr:DUF4238 domain-containing protein [Sinomonas humi]
MPQVSRKHHTVPKFYLKGFANDAGRIGTVRLTGKHRFVQPIGDASTQKDFYATPGHDDGPDAFERQLSAMEADASKVIRKIADKGVWPLTTDDRDTLVVFLTLQFLRGPDRRRKMEQMMSVMTRMEIGFGGKDGVAAWAQRRGGKTISEEEAARIWEEATRAGGPTIDISPAAHIQHLLDLLPKFVPYFAGRPWALFRFQRRSLLTCDTPISLLPRAIREGTDPALPPLGIGLATAWGISVPLTRSIGLMLANPEPMFGEVTAGDVATGRFDITQPPSSRAARTFNWATLNNAREWIFHHPDDAALVPQDLPEPTSEEIDVSDVPKEFTGEPLHKTARTQGSAD